MARLFLALAATVASGILSRLYPIGWYPYDDALGDVLYGVAAYLVLALLLFRKPPLLIALLALACCLAVELFKLTGIPAQHPDSFLVRWLLGTIFSWLNLAYYLLGILLIASAAWVLSRVNAAGAEVSGSVTALRAPSDPRSPSN